MELNNGLNLILCDTKMSNNIFPSAVIYRQLIKKPEDIMVIDIKAQNLTEELLEKKIDSGLTGLRAFYENEGMEFFLDVNKINFYLINVGPHHDQDMINILTFLEKHEEKIKLWIDTANDWLPNELKYVNQYRPVVVYRRDLSGLELLELLKYRSPLYWKRAEAALISLNIEALKNNPLALRYLEASVVSRNIGDNLQDNYQYFSFLASLDELIYNQADPDIDLLIDFFPKMIKGVAKAKNKISSKSIFFRSAKKAGRPVGYLNLGNIPSFINIEDILCYGQKNFPWLFIVRYQLDNKDHLLATSRILDIPHIIKSYSQDTKDHRTLLRLLNAEVIKYKK